MGVLLFDLDGVLADSIAAYRRAWTEWATHYRITREEFPADIHGLRPRDVIRLIAATRPDLDANGMVEDFDRRFGVLAAEQATAMPGAVELTQALAGLPWAIVSSSQRCHVAPLLAATGIAMPPVLICGDDIAVGKPDPACFLLAAERLGVAPAACTVVEDAPAGLEAARAACMASVAVATTHEPDEVAGADRVFPTLRDAMAFLMAVAGPPGAGPGDNGAGEN